MAVTEIDVDALEQMGPAAVQLVDVREPDEYHAARVPGARLIPLATIPGHLDQLDRSQPVYLICAVGGRSLNAAEWLAAQGFEVVNVVGGTKAWVAAGKNVDSGAALT